MEPSEAVVKAVQAERARYERVMDALNKVMGYAEIMQHESRTRPSEGYWVADVDFEALRESWEQWVDRGGEQP